MIRKIAFILILIVSTGILMLAMNQSFVNRIKQDRYFAHLNPPSAHDNSLYYRIFVRSDHWRFGDLYGLCFIPKFKLKLEPFNAYIKNPKNPLTNRVLYIIGDSFLADKVLNGAFDGFDYVVFLDSRFPFGPVLLDSSKQNYLILEFAERNLNRYRFDKTSEIKWTENDIKSKINFNKTVLASQQNTTLPVTFWERLNKILFNKDLSRNLDLLLFDDCIFTPVKESKASLNYNILGRTPKEVAISTDKERLLMNATVDTSNLQSAFRKIGENEINVLTDNLNKAKNYYISIGFKKVILAVIPNAVSIYDPGRMGYNHLLERVEQRNIFPVLSVFKKFQKSTKNLYYKSDTHWNPLGLDIWVHEANQTLLNKIH